MTIRKTRKKIKLSHIISSFDILVDAKADRVVMICANAKGRKVVEELWPDVEWTTDEKFKVASSHSDGWLFTHIRVTKLPPDFEGKVPLAFANPESLGFVVATALQRIAAPRRVGHFTGEGRDIRINVHDVPSERERSHTLFAEHVPAGTVLGQVGRA